MSFHKDLEFGKMFEIKFIEILQLSNATQSEGCVKEYDILSDGVKYEIKADKMASKTGNIAIEFSCNGKPSGINSTTSDKWGHFVVDSNNNYDLYLMDVTELKELIRSHSFRVVSGGDYNKAKLYLIPIKYFQSFFYFSSKK